MYAIRSYYGCFASARLTKLSTRAYWPSAKTAPRDFRGRFYVVFAEGIPFPDQRWNQSGEEYALDGQRNRLMADPGHRSRQRQNHRELTAFIQLRSDGDHPTVGIDNPFDDGKPQAAAADVPVAGFVNPVKPVKQIGEMLFGNADAGVHHPNPGRGFRGREKNLDLSARRGVFSYNFV